MDNFNNDVSLICCCFNKTTWTLCQRNVFIELFVFNILNVLKKPLI